jgi:hypothetical protein
MSEEIKPCPFDGGDAYVNEVVNELFVDEDRYWVVCNTCACEGPWSRTRSGALRGWNTRTEIDSGILRDELALQRGLLEHIKREAPNNLEWALSQCDAGRQRIAEALAKLDQNKIA